jgi:hypothetical protein
MPVTPPPSLFSSSSGPSKKLPSKEGLPRLLAHDLHCISLCVLQPLLSFLLARAGHSSKAPFRW